MTYDFAVIGAGMAGASLAAELSPYARVLLLEAEDAPGYHATGRSAAFWEECYGGPGVVPLTLASGPYLAEHFKALAEHPLIGEAQSVGLMGALQIVKDKATGACFDGALEVGMICRGHCFANGLIMRAVGDRMIIAPPLVITRAQLDDMVALIRLCLDATLHDLQQRGLT
jgi:hypothetical protein